MKKTIALLLVLCLLGQKGSLSVLCLRNTGITYLDLSRCGRIQKLLVSLKLSSVPHPLMLDENNVILETLINTMEQDRSPR